MKKCEGVGAGGRSFWRWLQRIKGPPLLPGRCVPPRACGTLTRLAGGPLYNYLILANLNVCISDSLRFSFGCSHHHIQECLCKRVCLSGGLAAATSYEWPPGGFYQSQDCPTCEVWWAWCKQSRIRSLTLYWLMLWLYPALCPCFPKLAWQTLASTPGAACDLLGEAAAPQAGSRQHKATHKLA